MLVLSRGRDESVNIYTQNKDGEVQRTTITVVEVRGNKVRLGFDAPKDIAIWRNEIDPNLEPGPE
jgi:carbon storage regulator